MDSKLTAKILFEISQIDKLLDSSKPLLDLCKLKSPDFIEMSETQVNPTPGVPPTCAPGACRCR